LDDKDAVGRAVLGMAHHARREHEEALMELQIALDLNPSSAFAHGWLGVSLLVGFGKAEEAIIHLDLAFRLSPCD